LRLAHAGGIAPATMSAAPKPFSVGPVRVDPAIVLAPMEGVTDRAFRTTIRALGGCGLAVTEFVSSEGLTRDVKDAWHMAELDPNEHPVSIQIYGRNPERMAAAARECQALGADIIDINLGCPSKNVTSGCSGSALMREPELARRIFDAVYDAITVPLTVKMRLGWDDNALNAPAVAFAAQEAGAKMITVHGRTKVDMYRVPARWEPIRRVREAISVPLLCNGDIVGAATATAALAASGADGIMVGRAVMTDPWTIARIHAHFAGLPFAEPTLDDRRHLLHAYVEKLVVQEGKSRRIVSKLRKTIGSFSTGLRNAARLRQSISAIDGAPEAHKLLDAFFDDLASRGELPQPWHEDVVTGADAEGAEDAVTGS
jgi:tRNA-dihydrouridine synthase B